MRSKAKLPDFYDTTARKLLKHKTFFLIDNY